MDDLSKLYSNFEEEYAGFLGYPPPNTSSSLYVDPSGGDSPAEPKRTKFSLLDSSGQGYFEKLETEVGMNSASVFLVMGDSGIGKTSFGLELCHRYWLKLLGEDSKNPNIQDNQFLPIYVYLPLLSRTNEIISDYLKICNLSNCLEFVRRQNVLLILDSFDEFNCTENLWLANQWQKWTRSKWIKVVVLSRPSSLPIRRIRKTYFYSQQLEAGPVLEHKEIYIQNFSTDQIKLYVQKYHSIVSNLDLEQLLSVKHNLIWSFAKEEFDHSWTCDDLYQWLTRIPELLHLSENPFLLMLILMILPKMVRESSDRGDRISKLCSTKVGVYDQFSEQWFTFQSHRVLKSKEPSGIYKFLAQDLQVNPGYLKKYYLAYAQNLAVSLIERQSGMLGNKMLSHVETIRWQLVEPHRDTELLSLFLEHHKDELFVTKEPGLQTDRENNIKALRNGCLLSYRETGEKGGFHFFHRSLVEYFASRELFENLQAEYDIWVQDVTPAEELLIKPGFNRELIKERAILSNLADWVRSGVSQFTKLLGEIVLKSAEFRSLSIMSSNAITVLNMAGASFSDLNFENIQIPGADLRQSLCGRTNFRGANLTEVKLDNSWMPEASFVGSNLKEIQLGLRPMITDTNSSTPFQLEYCHQTDTLFCGYSNGIISQFSVESGKLVKSFRYPSPEKPVFLKFLITSDQKLVAWDVHSFVEFYVWELNNKDQSIFRQLKLPEVPEFLYQFDSLYEESYYEFQKVFRILQVESSKEFYFVYWYHPNCGQMLEISQRKISLPTKIQALVMEHNVETCQILHRNNKDLLFIFDVRSISIYDLNSASDCNQAINHIVVQTFDALHHFCFSFSPVQDKLALSCYTNFGIWNFSEPNSELLKLESNKSLGKYPSAMQFNNKGDLLAARVETSVYIWQVATSSVLHKISKVLRPRSFILPNTFTFLSDASSCIAVVLEGSKSIPNDKCKIQIVSLLEDNTESICSEASETDKAHRLFSDDGKYMIGYLPSHGSTYRLYEITNFGQFSSLVVENLDFKITHAIFLQKYLLLILDNGNCLIRNLVKFSTQIFKLYDGIPQHRIKTYLEGNKFVVKYLDHPERNRTITGDGLMGRFLSIYGHNSNSLIGVHFDYDKDNALQTTSFHWSVKFEDDIVKIEDISASSNFCSILREVAHANFDPGCDPQISIDDFENVILCFPKLKQVNVISMNHPHKVIECPIKFNTVPSTISGFKRYNRGEMITRHRENYVDPQQDFNDIIVGVTSSPNSSELMISTRFRLYLFDTKIGGLKWKIKFTQCPSAAFRVFIDFKHSLFTRVYDRGLVEIYNFETKVMELLFTFQLHHTTICAKFIEPDSMLVWGVDENLFDHASLIQFDFEAKSWKMLWSKRASNYLNGSQCNIHATYGLNNKTSRLLEDAGATGEPRKEINDKYLPFSELFKPIPGTALCEAGLAIIKRTLKDRVVISEEDWLVSVIAEKDLKTVLSQALDTRHVSLIVEGILNNRRFIIKAHLVNQDGYGNVKIAPWTDVESFQDKAPGWEAQQYKIGKMTGYQLIRNAVESQQNTFGLKYSKVGNNCAAWVHSILNSVQLVKQKKWFDFVILPSKVLKAKVKSKRN